MQQRQFPPVISVGTVATISVLFMHQMLCKMMEMESIM